MVNTFRGFIVVHTLHKSIIYRWLYNKVTPLYSNDVHFWIVVHVCGWQLHFSIFVFETKCWVFFLEMSEINDFSHKIGHFTSKHPFWLLADCEESRTISSGLAANQGDDESTCRSHGYTLTITPRAVDIGSYSRLFMLLSITYCTNINRFSASFFEIKALVLSLLWHTSFMTEDVKCRTLSQCQSSELDCDHVQIHICICNTMDGCDIGRAL